MWSIPLIFSLASGIVCLYAAGGASLGLFFGPVLLMAFLAAPCAMAERAIRGKLLVGVMLLLGIAAVWATTAHLSYSELIRCCAVLAAFILALIGTASGLQSLGVEKMLASGAVIVTAIGWLTWPIWLSHQLAGPHAQGIVAALACAHPLLALNGVVQTRFNSWDRYTMAYQQLTTLNQDLLYSLPVSVWPAILLHGAIGSAGLFAQPILRTIKKSKPPTGQTAR